VPTDDPSLVDKIVAVHHSFEVAGIGHAFGGALALAYWTLDPRTTDDIDVNVALPAGRAVEALSALPDAVTIPSDATGRSAADEQIRVRWGRTPIDLFFRADPLHDGVARRTVWLPFASQRLPFLAADDLAVFKALFDRAKDWLDIAAMVTAGSIDLDVVCSRVAGIVGDGDERITRLRQLG
jgi:hypothetical protein